MEAQEDPSPTLAAVGSALSTLASRSSHSPAASTLHKSISKDAPATDTTATPVAGAWITRDVAERLLADRAALAAACHASGPVPLVATSAFDVEAVFERLRRHRTPAVHAAFDLAAGTVLAALQRRRGTTEPVEDDLNPAELPQVLRDWEQLEALRNSSFETTHGNKDSLKRSTSSGAASTGSRSVKISETVSVDGSATTDSVMPEPVTSKAPSHVASTTSSAGTGQEGPKFTRNTPASSAAALDYRFTSSRAILCAAGNLHFGALTPAFEEDDTMDVLNIPQNPSQSGHGDGSKAGDAGDATDAVVSTAQVNLGAVRVEATTLGRRSVSVANNAVRRSALRYEYRKENALFDRAEEDREFLPVANPFSWREEPVMVTDDESADEVVIPHRPKEGSLTKAWTEKCLPRLLAVMEKGAGHALYHDVNFASRHGRLADLLKRLSQSKENYGPHLIIAVEPELSDFAHEFYDINEYLGLVNSLSDPRMRVLTYRGSPMTRRKFRQYFSQAKGLPESPFHVLVTSYADFLSDYLHFCQVPWEVVILDDGLSWMSAAQGDHNSAVGTIWDGIWSTNDQHVGLAGTSPSEWSFECDIVPEASVKEAWIGLTARHRIMTSATMILEQRHSVDVAPVSGLIAFLAPHFAATVREEWDRSRITADSRSMDHFRCLVARSTIVHSADNPSDDMHSLALLGLTGKLNAPERQSPPVPEVIFDDSFVSAGKISFGRRSSLLWLGPSDRSWLRYELGRSELQHILDSMKISNKHGAFCEEITTASSTTSSGANGQVFGSHAFRLAVCCGRHFGSEQGLRQHINAVHAPPGTWLCRTCGVDCMTSQARTHHERSCGQPLSGAQSGDPGSSVGATPTVGQGSSNKSGVGKKKSNRGSPASAVTMEEKDPDGSLRVPGYRGVWVNKKGKHFLKLDGKTVTEEDSGRILWFDDSNEAAKKYDELIKTRGDGSNDELNFKADGSRRSFYDDINPASTSGLGGSAVSVVPALSVINIKDLPPHVKPLLRDPRQTSRTGGNSKRHVYAYRGVCRQARKGHDRWQSQISFMGVNHYLGTFDSEWDAAAIYAWAHLILYGEEATKQAQKEGEEAAAAYEQEQRDIAAGKIPEPQAKPKKPKKLPTAKADSADAVSASASKDEKAHTKEKSTDASPKKRKTTNKETLSTEKKTKTHTKACKLEKEAIGSTVAKGVTKALVLAPRFGDISDSDLINDVSGKLVSVKRHLHAKAVDPDASSIVGESFRPCIPLSLSSPSSVIASAMLVGLSPTSFDWDLKSFMSSYPQISGVDSTTAIQQLAVEYDEDGANEKFRSILQGSLATLGRASETTQEAFSALGLGAIPVGGAVGKIDCHVGGVRDSCSELAACISFSRHDKDSQSKPGTFLLSCLADNDIVTLNGKRITRAMGLFPLVHEDIVSVGARVMVVLLSTGV